MLALLEQELIERLDVETKVCPVLIDLTAPDSNDDVKTEAVAVSLLPSNPAVNFASFEGVRTCADTPIHPWLQS